MALVQVRPITKPKGLLRFFFRLPIALFRVRMGWIFGRRMLLLTHTGRKSRLHRRSVLEVIRYDKATTTYFLASGYGKKSDWFKNLLATPQARIMVGLRQHNVLAQHLERGRAEEELVDYWRRNPKILRYLSGMIGFKTDGTEEDVRALAKHIPIISLSPRE